MPTDIASTVRSLISADVILGQEVGLVPVNDIQGRFFLRMDIKLIEGHHVLVLEVIERPFFGLAVRRHIGGKRGVAAFGELNPHFPHGL